MSSHVYRIDTPAPFSLERTHPHLAIAIEAGIEWAYAAADAWRHRHAAERVQRKVTLDVAEARRMAYAMMIDDPHMAADLLAAADRYEATMVSEAEAIH